MPQLTRVGLQENSNSKALEQERGISELYHA